MSYRFLNNPCAASVNATIRLRSSRGGPKAAPCVVCSCWVIALPLVPLALEDVRDGPPPVAPAEQVDEQQRQRDSHNHEVEAQPMRRARLARQVVGGRRRNRRCGAREHVQGAHILSTVS